MGELESTMSAIELREWMTLSAREPIGYARSDYQAGIISAVIASVNSRKRYKPTDFTPFQNLPPDDADPAVRQAREFQREFGKATAKMRTRVIRPTG